MGLKGEAKKGMVWSFLQQGSVQLVNLGVQIFLARLLSPEDFGILAVIVVFNTIGISLTDGGMAASLIRNKVNNQADYTTVFYANIIISGILYLFIYLSSPLIESFFKINGLTNVIRVYSISFVISSFSHVQLAKLNKELNFKKPFILQLPSVIIAAILGIFLAFRGYGVWSLVYLNIVQSFVYIVFIWIFCSWRPSGKLDLLVFKYHFSFGYKMTISTLINSIYNNLYRILIGKFYSPVSVGYFHQADTLRTYPVSQLGLVLNKVTFPLFAAIDDDIKLKQAYRKVMNVVLYFSSSIMVLLILVAYPLFDFVFGEKWYGSVQYFQILCIASIMLPLGTYNLNILKVKGRSDLYLRLEIVKKIIGLVALLVSVHYSIMSVVWSFCITNILFAYLNSYVSGQLILYNIKEQIFDSLGSIFLPICLGMLLYLNKGCIGSHSSFMEILILGCIYVTSLLLLTFIFKRSVFNILK